METLHKDERGEIISVAKHADVLRITSKAGSRRAGHYHRRFGHHCLVVSGEITYLERPLGAKRKPDVCTYKTGETFWTGAEMEHLMLFPIDTEFFCFSVGARDHENYEDDTVRLGFQLDEQ